MKYKFLLVFVLISSFVVSYGQISELENFFKSQEGLNFRRIVPFDKNRIDYEIKLKQPLDHKDESKGYFYQRILLSHLSFKAPIVMDTKGYSLNSNTSHELTELLKANQIDVENRYFGQSLPSPLDYSYLNLEQASADLHRIHEIFSQLYTASNWISTGSSKGGINTLYYKYYFPNDVKASVSYVTPLPYDVEDERIYYFLDTIGSPECREKIEALQIYLLKNRDSILPSLKEFYEKKNFKFSYLSFEEAYEVSVLEFSFSFWQLGEDCAELPSINDSVSKIINYYQSKDPMSLFSDTYMNYYSSHYYQAATEIGYYGYKLDKFKNYLEAIPTDSNYSAIFTPNKMKLAFDPSLNQKLTTWLVKNGNNILYIYGSLDTWSACALTPSKYVNSKSYVLNDESHSSATIINMTKKDKKSCLKLLKTWMK